MGLQRLMGRLSHAQLFKRRNAATHAPPVLKEGVRFPYGPFKFRSILPAGTEYSILASTDLATWLLVFNDLTTTGQMEYVDSDASKHNHRFYRVVVGAVSSANVLGFVSITLPPGFSLIANPLHGESNTVADLFKDWPDGTSVSKFDTHMFRLAENELKRGKWSNPSERLVPGEGAIFHNPTSDYKSHNFVGDVVHRQPSIPIPSGFSLRSSIIPRPGHLVDDLGFPISEGDVVHVFERDRQQYNLHPFEGGRWKAGPPIISVGESFWIAKSEAGNWLEKFVVQV
jgi:hypothetical protein